MKREIWFALLGALILTAAPSLAQNLVTPQQAQSTANPAPAAPAVGDPLAVTADDHVFGKADAPVTIIEYGSLTCPHCAAFETEVMPSLTKKWIDTGKARLVFRAFPRDDADLHAAAIASCAPTDRFFPFVDALFGAQEQWVPAPDYKKVLARLALLGGMSKEKFDSCFDDKSIQDKLLASRLVATQQLGVDSTPTFFINGKKFDGAPTAQAFDSLLTKLAGS